MFLLFTQLALIGFEFAENNFVIRESNSVNGAAEESKPLWIIGKGLREGNPLFGHLAVLDGLAGLGKGQLRESILEGLAILQKPCHDADQNDDEGNREKKEEIQA